MVIHKSFLWPPPSIPKTDISTLHLALDEHSSQNASANLTESAKAGLNLNDRAIQNSANDTFSQLMTNAQVYAMAEKFIIPDLKLLAQEKFLQRAHGWPIPGLAAVVQEVLTSTPYSVRGLRNIVRDLLSLHVTEITSVLEKEGPEQYFVTTPESLQWASVLRQEGDFLLEVLGQVTTNVTKQSNHQHKVNAVPVENLRRYQEEVKRLECENKALRFSQDEVKRSERENKAPLLGHDEAKRLEREIQALRLSKGHAIRGKDNEIKAIRLQKNHEIKAIRSEKNNLLKRGGRLIAAISNHDYCRHCSEVFQPIVVGIGTLDDWANRGILKCKWCRTKYDWA